MSFKIIGFGKYVPKNVVTNNDLAKIMDTNDEWIKKRVGIESRHISTKEKTHEMAYNAAICAIENSKIDKNEIDLIICATVSSDCITPSVSCYVQKYLGISSLAFDINAACSSFIFLLEIADSFMKSKKAKKVLIIGAERMSKLVDFSDRSTAVIFGDGAGACILESSQDGFFNSKITVKGDDSVIKITNFSGNCPYFKEDFETPHIFMEGQETFKFAVNSITKDIKKVLEENNLKSEDISYIVPHQANKRIVELAADRLKIPLDKFYINIEEYGNTSSASIPIALCEMNEKGLLKKDQKIVLCAFGGGLSSACGILKI